MKNQPEKGFFTFCSEKTQNFYLEWLSPPLPRLSPLLFLNDNNFGFSFACSLSFLYCRGKKNNLFCRLAQAMCQWITFFPCSLAISISNGLYMMCIPPIFVSFEELQTDFQIQRQDI